MLFKDVIGREDLKEHLKHTVQNKRISHAQMFLGKEGSGGIPMALAYTRYILCENRSEQDACGSCRNCIRMDKLEHPDVHFSYPVQLVSKKVDCSDDVLTQWRELISENPYFSSSDWYDKQLGNKKQGTIGTKEAESIVKKLSLKSFEGNYKVLIMWLPELMNISASNKLLKIIEEPPANTLFILVSENADRIISTILSRTQLVKVLPPKEDEIAQYLADHYELSFEEGKNFAHLAERNVAEAIHLIKHSESSSFNIENFIQWMRICYKRDVAETINWVDQIAKAGREDQKSFLKYCLQMFRNAIVGHYTGGETVTLTKEQEGFLKKFAPFINHNNIVPLTESIEEAHYHIERNANPKILFMDVSLKIFLQLKKA
ncbi:DNA polymerase III subunit [Parvicella tangerina]|uniref:DNA polymerase III subunit delta n=1 Tax=Parvicella tangerina TaxID=2829795 RepID=A0A916JQC2_9FLAO|nr:DNA polymerase III subunit delta' [Parvicella tangerina]CAG5086953.1 DNA polymerase III subunit delta' [Parvicella tangerina]